MHLNISDSFLECKNQRIQPQGHQKCTMLSHLQLVMDEEFSSQLETEKVLYFITSLVFFLLSSVSSKGQHNKRSAIFIHLLQKSRKCYWEKLDSGCKVKLKHQSLSSVYV